MAGAAVSAVINKAADIGAKVSWLREDIRWLEREMRHMQGYLENAEVKKFANPNVTNLIKDIRDLVHDVEDILDIYLPQIESGGLNVLLKRMLTCCLPYLWASSMFSRKIEEIRRRVKAIDEDRKIYGVEDIPGTNDVSNVDPRTTELHVEDPTIVGFDQHIEDLKCMLEEHPFVSVVGMPGLGKTTLAKKVFMDIKNGFCCSASVSVSQNPDMTNLMRDIADKMGLEKEKQEVNLKANLYSFLQGKRYVVFLDDIWDTETWDSLKGCFPIDSRNASKIIITSRNSGVGRYIGDEDSLHQLHPFDYQTSWELFSRSIDIPSSELEIIGKQIVEKCGGVPLAIVLTVGMLRETGMSESSWNEVLHGMGENANDQCSQILRLSYRDLPTFLKPLFLYFGNFPEGYKFSAAQVIRLWLAEKFIPHTRGAWEPEDVGANYIRKLDARNLIQVVTRGHDGRVKKFRIHDLLHNLCVNIGREIDFLNTIDHLEVSSAKRVRRLTAHHHIVIEIERLIYEMTKLRALFHVTCKNEIEIKLLNDMLGRFKLLQVLILQLDLFSAGEVYIPYEIGSLSRLNYLKIQSTWSVPFNISSFYRYISHCVVIPRSIRNLKNLQTLDFQGCHLPVMLRIPVGIWKMKQLRHLILNHSYIFFDRTEGMLPNLQTLVGIWCNYGFKPNWLLKFTNLRKLKLHGVNREIMEVLCGPEPISNKLETLCCWSNGCTMSGRVSLAKYNRLLKLLIGDVWLQMERPLELPPSLIKLTLKDTRLTEDPMKILKNLPKLKFLNLMRDSYCGSKMDCSVAGSFPQLEILKLCVLEGLEELIEGEEMGMPRLKQVIIQGCPRLMRIPKRLRQLQIAS